MSLKLVDDATIAHHSPQFSLGGTLRTPKWLPTLNRLLTNTCGHAKLIGSPVSSPIGSVSARPIGRLSLLTGTVKIGFHEFE